MKIRYTKEQIEPIIKEKFSWRQVCLEIGIKPATGSQSYLKKKSIEWEIDFSHFTGQAHARGTISRKRSNAMDYCYNGSSINSHRLKERLIRDGIKQCRCEICGLSEWNNTPIVLELDHKDSNHTNNELINLQIICPNCHAQLTRQRLNMPK